MKQITLQIHNLKENPNDLPEREFSKFPNCEFSIDVIDNHQRKVYYDFLEKVWCGEDAFGDLVPLEVQPDSWCEIPKF